jgi:hypothetical protein
MTSRQGGNFGRMSNHRGLFGRSQQRTCHPADAIASRFTLEPRVGPHGTLVIRGSRTVRTGVLRRYDSDVERGLSCGIGRPCQAVMKKTYAECLLQIVAR